MLFGIFGIFGAGWQLRLAPLPAAAYTQLHAGAPKADRARCICGSPWRPGTHGRLAGPPDSLDRLDLTIRRTKADDATILRTQHRQTCMYLFHLRPNLAADPTYIGSLLTPEECNRIIGIGERDLKLGPGQIESGRIDATIRKSDIGWMTPEGEHRWLFDRIKDCVNAINADWYRYNLIGIEGLQFAKYSGTDGQSNFYASHVDLKATDFGSIRKLSFSIQLSQPEAYDGGDVLLYRSLTESSTMSKAVGSITFFPSYTIHEVLPVTRGIRYSLVGWAHGPAFV